MKALIIGLALLVGLAAAPSLASAHEGHAHKVMGAKISSIQGTNLMVKGTDGKTVMVMMDAKTKVTKGRGQGRSRRVESRRSRCRGRTRGRRA